VIATNGQSLTQAEAGAGFKVTKQKSRNMEKEGDVIHTTVGITIGLADRLRLLVAGKASMKVETWVKEPVNIIKVESQFWIHPMPWKRKMPVGYVEVGPPEAPSSHGG